MGESELIAVALLAAVGIITTAMLYLGVTGMLGALYIVRCRRCDHWTFSLRDVPTPSCARCRHPALLHPVQAILSGRQATAGD
jgi:hypothetical protein